MPCNASFFKPPLPFHRLVLLYPKITQAKEISIDEIFTALEQGLNVRRIPFRNIVTPARSTSHSKENSTNWEGIPYIPLKGLDMGVLATEEIKPLRENLSAKFYTVTPSPSTILYALTDPRRKRVALLKDMSDNTNIAYNTNIAALTVTNPACDPAFCMWGLVALPQTQFISGTIIPRISQANLLQYHLPLPSLNEQKRIIDTLDAIDKTLSELRKKQAEQRQKLDELEQTIITQALQGVS